MKEPLEKISNFLLDKKKENLKYNKQEIPDKLKYNSDDEESFISKENHDNVKLNNDNNDNSQKVNDNLINKTENNEIDDNKEKNKNDIDKKDEKNEKEKNPYELLLLKKIKSLKDDDEEKNQNNEIKESEKEKEKKIDTDMIENIDLNNRDNKYSSKTFQRNIEIKPNNENNESNDKKNFLKLLSLLKNKMNEKEKIDKEKEEILKRAKSQEGSKEKKSNKKEINDKINQIIYNNKRKSCTNNKSFNLKYYNNLIKKEEPQKRNKININIYKHHTSNKSMDINMGQKNNSKAKKVINLYNNIKKTQIQTGKSLKKVRENKKIINNYYFSNSNYNFNNFFQNNLSPKIPNKIYKKKNLALKENNIEYINSYSKSNNMLDNSSENNGSNYKTNIENYDSSPGYSSMNTNRYTSKSKINLKVNKKSFYINTNFELENISFKSNKNKNQYNSPSTKSNKSKIAYSKKNTQKVNYFMKANYKTDKRNKKNINMEILNQKKKKWNLFKLEDLLIIEEKMITLLEYIKCNKEIFKQCFDIFNYFYNSSLYKKLENIFNIENYINLAKLNIKFGLISLIILYEYSFNRNIFIQTKNELMEIIEANYNNLCLIKQQIINDLIRNDYEKEDNHWIKYLLKDMNDVNIKINLKEDNTLLIIKCLNQNNENIEYKLSNLLNYFPLTENNLILNNLLFQMRTKSYDDINNFMKKQILKIENIEGSLIADVYLRNNSIFYPINPPYIKTPLINKQYTLVLDLDETLVNFKIKAGREGYVRLRPFLFGFLEEVSQYYELIIFTSATEAYANSVIEAIEQEKKYFDFIFHREHTIIIGNEFVKDLTRIGRPLNSTIIIDNMPQNFRFQKENGICIKPFWGQDSNDKTLYNLIPILIDVAKMGGDVRISLNKFKDDIVSKITSNIS